MNKTPGNHMKYKTFKTTLVLLITLLISTILTVFSVGLAQPNEKYQSADLIVIWKSKRKMTLFKNEKPLQSYIIRLGFNPLGPKQKQGDGKTPEGKYFITHKNPKSNFHLSLGINYPNQKDKKLAKKLGFDPGDNIFIHGGPKNIFKHIFSDWTDGCVAVTDKEIEQIYKMIKKNTVVYIHP